MDEQGSLLTGGYYEDISYDNIQDLLDRILGSSTFDFKECVGNLLSGQETISLHTLLQSVWHGMLQGIAEQKDVYFFLIILSLFMALFTNFTKMLQGKQVAGTAFYVTYSLFFATIASSFYAVQDVARVAVSDLLDFMKVLVPSFFIGVSFSTGPAVSAVFYEFTLVVIAGVTLLLLEIIMPVVNIYFVLSLANQLSEEDMLSGMTGLLETFVKWSMKSLLGIVLGMNVIQGLIVPNLGQVKKSAMIKAVSMVPGVGNGMNAVAETVLSAGVLVKNAIGVTGLLAIVMICIVPIGKLIACGLSYQLIGAFLQPVSDKRIIKCVESMTKSVKLLLYTLGLSAVLFLLSITLISTMTG